MNKILMPLLAALLSPIAQADDLLQVYNAAKESDNILQEAASNRDAALESGPLAKSQLLPQVGLDADTAYINRDIKQMSRSDYDSSSLSLGVVQPLYRRDRLMRLEQADWIADQAEASYAGVEQSLMIRTASAYFEVLQAQDALEFKQQQKKAIERQLDQAKQRYDVGLIPITGVLEAQAGYDQANTDEIIAANDVDARYEALREIIAYKPKQLSSLKEEVPLLPPDPAKLEDWVSKGLENNPSVRAASDATQVAQKEMDVQYSGHYPTLDAYANYTLARTGNELSVDADTASIGLRLSVPIYTGGYVSASTRQARSYLLAAQEQLDQARRAVDRDVSDSYRNVHAAISAVKSLKAGVVSAQSALDATTAGFDVGTRTMVDVLNEQSKLFQAKSNYSKARYSYLLAKLKLKSAAGTLQESDIAEMNQLLQATTTAVN